MTASEIARSNALAALDQEQGRDYPVRGASISAHLVNVVDTAREYRVSAEEAVAEYLRLTVHSFKR